VDELTQQVINTGTFANDATGDPAQTAFTKCNTNFTQLFGGTFTYPTLIVTGSVTAGSFIGPLTGAVTGNVTGNLAGNQSGGSISATTGAFSSNVTMSAPASGNTLALTGVSGGTPLAIVLPASAGNNIASWTNTAGNGGMDLTASGNLELGAISANQVNIYTSNTTAINISAGQQVKLAQGLGIFGNTPAAQVSGWGTPTGAAVQSNFSGSAAPLTTCSAAIAEIIVALKAVGIFAA
jgi:hypothetical protein